jgi:Family of unknown function (DUF6527)
MVRPLTRLWNRLRYRRRYCVTRVVDAAAEIPSEIPTYGAVVVGSSKRPTWIAFDCPCCRGHRVMLNLDYRRYPYWTLAATRPISLRPSIDAMVDGRRCHYFVHRGKVHWIPDPIDTEFGGAR